MFSKLNKPNPLWFRAKEYGWGWTPATWQGWLLLLVYVVLVSFIFSHFDSSSHSVSDTLLNFVPLTLLLTCILIFICFATGDKPSWRWGRKDTIKTKA
jgi:uncharacterized membrane protein YhaH (DUF805 family)